MKTICLTCKGNGFIKTIQEEDGEVTIHQCWECQSTGEIKYEDMGNKSEYAYTILSNVLISLL